MGLEGFFLYHPEFSILSAIWGGGWEGNTRIRIVNSALDCPDAFAEPCLRLPQLLE